MKAAVIVPPVVMPAGPSGGLRGLHYISRELRDHCGVDAITVGIPYPHSHPVGDAIVNPLDFDPDEDTAIILPEGYHMGGGGDLDAYYEDMLAKPHGPVVVYAQGWALCEPYNERETHYWGLGKRQQELVRETAGLPETFHVERLLLPVEAGPKVIMGRYQDGDSGWNPHATYLTTDPCRRQMRVHPDRIPGSIFYGSNRNVETLDAVARRCSAKPSFRVAGCTPGQIRTLMAQADIFVLASASEGQSVFANEAMAMEMAVVTWESGGMPDIITHGETGMLVKQNDVFGLVDCVRQLQGDPELARKLGTNAREWVKENLSWDRFRSDLQTAWTKVESWTPESAPPAEEQAESAPTT